MGIGKDLFGLMKKINYHFRDVSILERALTHTSYSNELRKRGFRAQSNESLEFVGDAVLELIISEELYSRCPESDEGLLTKYRQSLVCEGALAKCAASISLGEYLNIGTSEENTNIRTSRKVLADSLEALIAAVYLDSEDSIGSARAVILSLMDSEISTVILRGDTDYKSMLQQFVEKNAESELRYEYTESGPEHNKCFTARAFINNNSVGEGKGKSKRAAEMNAAKQALTLFGIIK